MNPLCRCLLLAAAVNAAVPVFVEDAADKVKAGFKTRSSRTMVDTIVVEWQPADLVMDKQDIDMTQQIVELKSGDGDWVKPGESPTPRRGKYRATFHVVPCKSHSLRFVMKSLDGEEATYLLPTVIGPASQEQILDSRFTPEAPNNIIVSTSEDGQVTVSWEPSECATKYEVYGSGGEVNPVISGTTEDTSIVLEGAQSCVTYEIAVTAFTGEEASEEATVDYTIQPTAAEASKLTLEIAPTRSSVVVSWDGWATLSCVADYAVTLCHGDDCSEGVTVPRHQFGGKSTYSSDTDLEECSEYTVHVKPMYEGLDLEAKTVTFRTLPPEMEVMKEELGTVTAETEEENMIHVTWSPVKCATSYQVFQKQNIEGSEWEHLDTATASSISTKGVPCTEYSYGVKAIIGELKTDLVEAGSPVEIALDRSVPYHPPALIDAPSENSLTLTWDHSNCISAYRVKHCVTGSEECVDSQVTVDETTEHSVTHTIGDLDSCTNYTLSIFATNMGEELSAEDMVISTLYPVSTPPQDMTADLNTSTGKVEISFSPVVCASGYKIQRKGEDGEMEAVMDTEDTEVSLPAPQPCETFSLGVSSIVDGVESAVTDLVDVSVLASDEDTSIPELVIVKTENMTVEFVMNTPSVNNKCEVESYEIKYISLDSMSEPEIVILQPSEEGNLIIEEFPGAADKAMRLEGRIKYGDGVTSPWVTSKEPTKIDPTDPESGSIVVPIVIGILVAVVVLLAAIFVVFKRRKSQRKYDTESAKNEEETKQLKESH